MTPKISASFEARAPGVSVRIDQAGKERVACGVDRFHVRRDFQALADSLDLAALDPDVGLLKRFAAVEHACTPDYETLAMVVIGKDDRRCGQQQIECHPAKDSEG